MGKKDKVYIIAEAGVNHNGSLAEARRLADLAKNAGADAVKFQSFRAEKIATAGALKVPYQLRSSKKITGQLSMLKRLELDASAHRELLAYCRRRKIDFLSTAFDEDSIDLLSRLGMKAFKIPSGEVTNIPHLRKVASVAQDVILSTGMSTMREVIFAVEVLQKAGIKKSRITILQCNTEYPTPPQDVNLMAMVEIKKSLGVNVGYSDHTLGIEAALAAVALGACVIEKHLTRDRHQKGPDHLASLEFDEFKAMVKAIRNIEMMLGDGIKRPSKSEQKNIINIRRSIVAKRDIRKGERFSQENLTTKRPAYGLSPVHWDRIIGRKAKINFRMNEAIKL